MREDRLDSVALLGVGALLGAVAIALAVPPANRYELSIYDAYPEVYWILVVLAIFAGSLVIVGSAGISGNRSWIYGLGIVLLTNAMLLLLPYIRGYQMFGRGDALSHIGFVRDILSGGGIEANIYPPLHLLVIAISGATGTQFMGLTMLVPVVTSGVYFGAMYYLLRHLFESRERVLLALPFGMIPLLRHAHTGLRPFDLSLLLVPLALYTFVRGQRNNSPPSKALFVVVLGALLLYHPLTALFVVFVFSIYVGARHFPRIVDRYASPTNVLSIATAIFVAWYSNFPGIILRFEGIYEVLFGVSDGEAPLATYAGTVEETSPALIDLIRVGTFKYGLEFTLFGLGFLFLGLAVVGYFALHYKFDTYAVTFAGTLGLFSVGGLLFLVLDLIVPPERPFQMAKVGAVVLIGSFGYVVWGTNVRVGGRSRRRSAMQTLLVVGLLLTIGLSVFSLYKSPLASQKNHQVTEMEVAGADWLTENRASSITSLSEVGMRYYRFYEAGHGRNRPKPFWGTPPPAHFNYSVHETLGESYSTSRYLSVTRLGRIIYPEAFPNYPEDWRYTPDEFRRLERDPSVTRVYDNGDYNQYVVAGTADG